MRSPFGRWPGPQPICGGILVHFGTDFVFDGRASRSVHRRGSPNPRSAYAVSKLLGEWFAADAPRAYVLRVESLFGRPRRPARKRQRRRDPEHARSGGATQGVRGSNRLADLRQRRRGGDARLSRSRRPSGCTTASAPGIARGWSSRRNWRGRSEWNSRRYRADCRGGPDSARCERAAPPSARNVLRRSPTRGCSSRQNRDTEPGG